MSLRIVFVLLCLSYCLYARPAHAQSHQDIVQLSPLLAPPVWQLHADVHAQHNANVLKIALEELFVGYKRYISSQDGSSCSFTPSCSVYALQSVRRRGVFLGVLDGFDRLTRCYGSNHRYYDTDPKTGRCYDPVR